MNIIILYEHIVRELEAIKRLQAVLIQRGHNCELFSGNFEVMKAFSYAKKHKIDVIIIPWFSDEEHFDLIYPIMKSNPDIKVINPHYEEISSKVYENSLYPRNQLARENSYHFSWGHYFADFLTSKGIDKDRIFITGNFRNDKAFHIENDKNSLASQFGLDPNKKWILYAEDRGWASQRITEVTRKVLLGRGITEEELQESIENSAEGLKQFYQILNNLPDDFFKRYEFIYRPHPGTQVAGYIQDKIHVICELPIYEWIGSCDLFLVCDSTSIFEAEICGVPCAVYNNLPKREKFWQAGVSRFPKLSSLDEINDELIEKIAEQQKKQCIYEDYLGVVDGHAVDRMADAIEDIAKKDSRINFFGHKENRKFLFRHHLYEILTYIIVKLGLMNKLRYPRSAYYQSRDIPYSKENKKLYFQK